VKHDLPKHSSVGLLRTWSVPMSAAGAKSSSKGKSAKSIACVSSITPQIHRESETQWNVSVCPALLLSAESKNLKHWQRKQAPSHAASNIYLVQTEQQSNASCLRLAWSHGSLRMCSLGQTGRDMMSKMTHCGHGSRSPRKDGDRKL